MLCTQRILCFVNREYKLMQPPWKTLVFFPCYLPSVPEIPPQRFCLPRETLANTQTETSK